MSDRDPDWDKLKRRYEDHSFYRLTNFQLSDEKLESLDAVMGIEGESKLSPEARERIVIEITTRALIYVRDAVREARREEAAKAIADIISASSLAEAKAKAIWRQRNIR